MFAVLKYFATVAWFTYIRDISQFRKVFIFVKLLENTTLAKNFNLRSFTSYQTHITQNHMFALFMSAYLLKSFILNGSQEK